MNRWHDCQILLTATVCVDLDSAEALADLFTTRSICYFIDSDSIRWNQTCCNWYSIMNGLAAASHTRWSIAHSKVWNLTHCNQMHQR